jgi:hypothetical protein
MAISGRNDEQGRLIESGERYKHLKATFGETDVMVGAYCRQHGLYPHQLAQSTSC